MGYLTMNNKTLFAASCYVNQGDYHGMIVVETSPDCYLIVTTQSSHGYGCIPEQTGTQSFNEMLDAIKEFIENEHTAAYNYGKATAETIQQDKDEPSFGQSWEVTVDDNIKAEAIKHGVPAAAFDKVG